MTTRYKTEGEKAGVRRRVAAVRKRKKEAGLTQHTFWLTDTEFEKVKEFIEGLRKKPE
jgi:hypothetical protein